MYAALVGILVLYSIIEFIHGRKDHAIGFKEAVRWSILYVGIAVLFVIPVYLFIGQQASGEYLAALAIEKALSLDNLFVFGLIFTAFKVEQKYRRRILNYGIAGAIIFRLIFILVGFTLLKEYAWVSIIFGVVLLHAAWNAYKNARYGADSKTEAITDSKMWKLINKIFPIYPKFDGHKLMTRVNGKRMFTLMFGVIVMIELTDIVFALDSVPAVLAVSPDSYIAYASNVLAILGLRSLFFVYDAVSTKFWAIDWSLVLILVWIGFKMIATPLGFHPPIAVSLGILFTLLTAAFIVSLKFKNPYGHKTSEVKIYK